MWAEGHESKDRDGKGQGPAGDQAVGAFVMSWGASEGNRAEGISLQVPQGRLPLQFPESLGRGDPFKHK